MPNIDLVLFLKRMKHLPDVVMKPIFKSPGNPGSPALLDKWVGVEFEFKGFKLVVYAGTRTDTSDPLYDTVLLGLSHSLIDYKKSQLITLKEANEIMADITQREFLQTPNQEVLEKIITDIIEN